MQVQTINLKGNEYALVPQRLKQFRQDNPRAIVDTDPVIQADGSLVFKARIVKDKNDPNSAEATGHSFGKLTGDKAFEKLETVAVGRALSMMGYLNNGQIASTEEMEEFEEYKLEQLKESIQTAEHREDFAEILSKLTPELKKFATPLINKRIEELRNVKADTSRTA